jgi:hypothetical protein
MRSKMYPPSVLEFMLVDSTPNWPREEKMLLYKLEQLEGTDTTETLDSLTDSI